MKFTKLVSSLLATVAIPVLAFAQYETAPNDPMNVKIGTLSNGMKVYMSVYKDAPRIQTLIATRAGSKNDPEDATGLAHYLEHMLFKGNSHFGTKDWAKEKAELQVISDLYEQRRKVKDPAERTKIYAKIDSVSQLAASYAIANEYDKMMAGIGAQGTNAFTWLEETVYVEDIPSNELEKWANVEGDRFKELTLRLFHTELEAVYEEFNIGQGRDDNRVYETLYKELFPTHTYGSQTTIGTSEHLKNPSMVKIHEYFNKYYVPNNMAIILAGDLDPDKTMKILEKYFGTWKQKEVPKWVINPQAPITKPIEREVFGNEAPYLSMAYRFAGAGSDDALKIELLQAILNNGQAGVLDLDLIQKQKVLGINASINVFHDYSVFGVDGKCREGQTPEQVRDLFLAEIEKVKKGDFPDWLVGAAVKYLKLQDIKKVESNQGRAFTMLDAFITEQKWADVNTKYDRMSKITKKELVDFVAKNFGTNFVAIFKRQGEAKDIAKVEKPKITPVPLNKVDKSTFKAAFDEIKSEQLAPKFIDFKKDMKTGKLKNGVTFDYIKNPDNPTFELYYTVDMGSGNDKVLPIAIKLLPYLGTSKYTPEQLQQEMFKLGISFNVFAGEDRTYVMLKGLEESFEKGTELFEHILANAKPDQKALEGVVADILKEREDAAKDKSQLRRALNNYGKFGPKSPFTNVLNTKELQALKAKDLTQKIKELTSFKHNVFYYGTKTEAQANAILSKNHKATGSKEVPKATEFAQQSTDQPQVFVVNFTDLPQAEISMISKDGSFDPKVAAQAALYNEYFGGDMSSVIFQEIRESRALAYSTWASYITPQFTDRAYYMQAYVGTQVDKLKEATGGVLDLVKNMPVQPERIEAARAAMLKRIKNERITKADVYWSIRNDKRMGYDHDSRKDVYEMGEKMTVEDVVKFQKEHIKDKNFVILVVGDRKKLDMKYLETLGKVTELSVQDVLGYDVHP